MESVSSRFSCGDLFFEDDHHLSKVILQRKDLTCKLPIEKGYYNNDDRKLKLKSPCYHCGESGSTSYMFGLEELGEKSLADGYSCYSIFTNCMPAGKGVVKHGKQDNMQARNESENSQGEIKRRAEEQEQYNLWCVINSKPHSFN